MSLYFFYQEKEKSRWFPALASERQAIIRTRKPALVSVLDADNDFSDELNIDDIRAIKYFGPLYFDFDAADLEEATQQFQKFLLNLKAKGVNLEMLRLFATGKKGYHIEVPPQMLMGKVPSTGTPHLPHIFKEMAHALYVDTLDLRVYSAKRGRMWRCPNVERADNGKFKVQLTVDEAFAMTGESYMQVCSSPRNSLPIEPPTLCPELGLLFAQARDKVEKSVVKAKKTKGTANALDRFKKEWPDTLAMILLGVGVKPDVGWNHISMQLATTAAALGKSEEQLLEDAAPLIEGHSGDSDRYGSPRKRRDDLREMYRYVSGNPCFEFSVGGVLSLILPELRANADISFGDYVPDEKEAPKTTTVTETLPDGTTVIKEVTPEPTPEEDETGPVRVAKSGVYTRSEFGWVTVSEVGIGNPVVLKKMDNTIIGYDVDTFLAGVPLGRQVLTMDKLSSKASMQNWTMQWSASMSASDNQTAKVADILRRRTQSSKATTYIVTREGLDLIVPPGVRKEADFDLIWSSPDEVKSTGERQYRFRSHLDKDGTFRSDLLNAPALTLDDAELVYHLLHINTPNNTAKLLGWFSAAFMTQIVRRYFKQFPSLQVFGQSGAGKSKTTGLLNHLHYYMKDPKSLMAQGQTQYPMIVAVASSASIPIIFEEVKAREMSKQLRDFLLNLFRNNYDGHSMARGALTKDQSTKEVTVNEFGNAGPVVFVGEAVENQSAILERCIVVSLSKTDRYGKADHYHYCSTRRPDMGKIGRAMMLNTLSMDLQAVRDEMTSMIKAVSDNLGDKAEEMERPAFNLAVVLLGLQLLRKTLNQTFGDKFEDRMQELHDSVLGAAEANIPRNMAEASRVLDVMAQLTRSTDQTLQLIKGVDYLISKDSAFVDLKMKNVYAKYVKYQRSLGFEVLYDNSSVFISSMSNYGGTVARAVPDSPLMDNPMACIYRVSTAYMEKEEIEMFT